jgi:hypothetical protein
MVALFPCRHYQTSRFWNDPAAARRTPETAAPVQQPSVETEIAMAGSATVLTYTRGSTYVRNITSGSGATATYAHGLVGTLEVGGHRFDTVERMNGYVCMAGDETYANSAMYWHKKYSYVINPWLGKDAEATKKKNILFHRGSRPSHFEGCVGVGTLVGDQLTGGTDTFRKIWELVGGAKGAQTGQVVVSLKVVGKMKSLSACTAHVAG